jgi:hypothetical protein
MNIIFEEKEKKFKTSFLKDLENNIKILKNIFDEVYIDNKGICYSLESKLEAGRVYCNTNLNKLFEIEENKLLRLNMKAISDCLKAGKSKIIGFFVDKDKLIFRNVEMDYEVGEFQNNKKLNIDYINEIINNTCYTCNLSELIDRFNNKEFINIKKGKYDLILTHKLFPMINKSNDFNFKAKENDNGSFYGIFENKIEERNKKEEITFEMTIVYLYRFLDLN